MSEQRRELIDDLAKSVSRLCHRVIARRLEQFFEVILEEVSKARQPSGEPCRWTKEDGRGNYWIAGCGWPSPVRGGTTSFFKFCPFCGNPLEKVSPSSVNS